MNRFKCFIKQPLGRKPFFIRCLILELIFWCVLNGLFSFLRETFKNYTDPYIILVIGGGLTVIVFLLRGIEYAYTAKRARDIGITPWIFLSLAVVEKIFSFYIVPLALLLFAIIPSKKKLDPNIKVSNCQNIRLSDFDKIDTLNK